MFESLLFHTMTSQSDQNHSLAFFLLIFIIPRHDFSSHLNLCLLSLSQLPPQTWSVVVTLLRIRTQDFLWYF